MLEARAQIDGPSEPVFVRVAEHDSRIYLDLGDDTWRSVEIGTDGWRIVDRPPVRVRRPAGIRPLPMPVKGGSIEKLKDFVNIDEGDFLLLIAFLAAAMRVSGPYPILVLTGEQGAAKSTLARIIRLLIDPHVMPLRSEPREPRDLVIGAINGWVLVMDNLSTVPAWLSDTLCRLSTGGGQANRTLYTNDEETFLDAQRPVVLTGIADFVNRGDLIDRCVFLHLPVIAEDKRQTEAMFKKAFNAAHAELFGACWTRLRVDFASCRTLTWPAFRPWPTSLSSARPSAVVWVMTPEIFWSRIAETARPPTNRLLKTLPWPPRSASWSRPRDGPALLPS